MAGAERKGNDTFRWAKARASLELTLDHAAPLRVKCAAIRSRGRRARPDADARGQRPVFGPAPLAEVSQAAAFDVPENAWRAGSSGRARVRDTRGGPLTSGSRPTRASSLPPWTGCAWPSSSQAEDRVVRVLYCAIDQRVPGTLGGSVHTRSVAEGLAALGHEVHVCAPGEARFQRVRALDTRWRRPRPLTACAGCAPRGHGPGAPAAAGRRDGALPQLRRRRHPRGESRRRPRGARGQCAHRRSPRFGQGAAWTARSSCGRWRAAGPRSALARDLFVTPTAAILPPDVVPDRVLELEWGADTSGSVRRPGPPRPSSDPRRSGGVSPAPSARGTAPSISCTRLRCSARAAATIWRRVRGDRSRAGAPHETRPRASPAWCSRGALPHERDAGRTRLGGHRCRAVRPVPARGARDRVLLVPAQSVRVHGERPSGRGATNRAARQARRARPPRRCVRSTSAWASSRPSSRHSPGSRPPASRLA